MAYLTRNVYFFYRTLKIVRKQHLAARKSPIISIFMLYYPLEESIPLRLLKKQKEFCL